MQYAKRSILIVEDNLQDFIIFKEVLGQIRDFFISMDHAQSVSEALELTERNAYDIIFLDLFLPDSYGQETFTTLQQAKPQCPIVILSGLSDKNIALEIVKLGAQDYLVKGDFDSNLLEKSIIYSIERRRYQDRLERNERRYRSTFRNIGVSIIEMDITKVEQYHQALKAEGVISFGSAFNAPGYAEKVGSGVTITDMNPEALGLLGYPDAEAFAQVYLAQHVALVQQFSPLFMALWNERAYYEGEITLNDSKGQSIFALVKVKFLQEDSGAHRMLISIADITALKEKEQEVLRQSRILQGISDSATVLLYQQEARDSIEKSLRILTELLEGFHAEVYLLDQKQEGKPVLRNRFHYSVGHIAPAFVEKLTDGLHQWLDDAAHHNLSAGECIQLDYPETTGQDTKQLFDEQHLASLIIAPLLVDGMLEGLVVLGHKDVPVWSHYELSSLQTITGNIGAAIARHNAQKQLQDMNDNLEGMVKDRTVKMEAAIQELESFSYSISHDLRAPLRAITGFSQVLEDTCKSALDEAGERYLGHIVRGADEMSQLIDDLLDFSRMGRKPLNMVPLDMNALVTSQIRKMTDGLDDRDIRIQVDALHPCKGDASMIRQVLQNFIGNAIKYTRTQKTATIHISSKIVENGKVEYCISDNGVGFDMAYVDKIFGVFQRLHPEHEFDGTGVGLAIVQRIVLRHGGHVSAYGEVDNGAKFTFLLQGIDEEENARVSDASLGVNHL